MKKNVISALVLLTAALLTACGGEKEPPAVTSASTSATEPEADHSLVRSFTINEIFADLYAEEIHFSFPVASAELEAGGKLSSCTFEENRLVFPGGSYAEAAITSSDGMINYLRAEKGTAPDDFSAYGIKFGMTLNELRYDYGMPDTVSGNPETEEGGAYHYYGAGAQIFTVEFSNGVVTAMSFMQ